MATQDMTTIKIDRGSLSKLRMLADRENRSQSNQLAILIDNAFRTNLAESTDQELFTEIMDAIVSNTEHSIASEEGISNAKEFSAAGRISWGEKNGKIIGVMADGTRCDVDGNILAI